MRIIISKFSEFTVILRDSGLWGAGLPGVRVARQLRSRETGNRLIAAGHRLLATRSLDALSIEDLCEAAECTVGAFYSRFDSKEAYFSALQFVICAERDASLRDLVVEARTNHWPLHTIAATLVIDLVTWYRLHQGVLRASLLHGRHGQNAWSSIKDLGIRHKAVWVQILSAHLATGLSKRDRRQRILFGHQVVNGTLVHMLLNNPGPVTLTDKAASDQLVVVLTTYLTA